MKYRSMMTSWLFALAVPAAIACSSWCSHSRCPDCQRDPVATVPEEDDRITLPAGSAASLGTKPSSDSGAEPATASSPTPASPVIDWQQARERATCLLRAPRAKECKRVIPAQVCTVKSEPEVRQSLEPFFAAVPALKLVDAKGRPSATGALPKIQAKFPSAVVTTEVRDARRQHGCADAAAPPCLGIRYGNLWVVVHATRPGDGTIDQIDMFAAGDVCSPDFHP